MKFTRVLGFLLFEKQSHEAPVILDQVSQLDYPEGRP